MFVSIITVNYNGINLLNTFLKSVFSVDYPKDKYEVIVVDNASTDGSKDFIRNNYKKVKLVESEKNLGFGVGNNLGINIAKGDLLFLVNNDTYVSKDALRNAVECFEKHKNEKIGAITSKLVLMDKYLQINLVGARFSDYGIKSVRSVPINKNPFIRNFERDKNFTQEISLPFNFKNKDELGITIIVSRSDINNFSIYMGGKLFLNSYFKSNEKTKNISMKLDNINLKYYSYDLIQNAGNFYFRDGAGRDRGVYIVGDKQYYEADEGQYENDEFVPGFNGAGVFLNRKTLDEVGLFDENFFMYYEDGDMSHRMIKKGWKILYCPKTIIRHIHSASSIEWSDFFVYHTERNRLLMVFKHWPLFTSLWLWFIYFVKDTLGTSLYFLIKGESATVSKRLKVRLKINGSLFINFFRFLPIKNRYTNSEVKDFL